MRRDVVCLLLAAFVVFSVACQEEGVVQVRSLRFNGVQHIEEAALKAVLATHVNSKLPWGKKAYFDRSRFDADLKRIQTFYIDRGYDGARVTGFDVHLNEREDAVDITITVSEGTPVRIAAVNLVGLDVLPPATLVSLRRQDQLAVGQPRDRQLVLATHERVANELRDHGYPYSTVTVKEDDGPDGKSATLTFEAEPGTLASFGPVEVRGNERVSENVVRRGLPTRGSAISTQRPPGTQRRLYATQLFQFVTVGPTTPGTNGADAAPDDAIGADGDRRQRHRTRRSRRISRRSDASRWPKARRSGRRSALATGPKKGARGRNTAG